MAEEINDQAEKRAEWLNNYLTRVSSEFKASQSLLEENRLSAEQERQQKLAEISLKIKNVQGESTAEPYLKILQNEVKNREVKASYDGAIGAKAQIDRAADEIHRLDASSGKDWGAIARGKRNKQFGESEQAQNYAENDDLYQAGNINKAA